MSEQLMWPRDGEWTLRDQFQRFHKENPHVYVAYRAQARRWRERHPSRRCGINMLTEVVRWTAALETHGEPLKINNNYAPFYARLLMEREPDLEGMFVTREQRR